MRGLAGARVALLETRLERELGTLVRRHGGTPVCAPAVRESPVSSGPEVAVFIDQVIRGAYPVVVLQTGVGVRRLFQEAERLGRRADLVAALKGLTLAVRGPKPSAALAQAGLRPTVTAPEPFTTTDLLAALGAVPLETRGVGVVHYGERNPPLVAALLARGARVHELQLYEWHLPDDLEPLRALVREIVRGDIAAVCFTTRVQLRHLLEVAAMTGLEADLLRALTARTVTVSVGPSCTAALRAVGISPHVEPSRPKMGAMIAALAEYLARWRDGGARSGRLEPVPQTPGAPDGE